MAFGMAKRKTKAGQRQKQKVQRRDSSGKRLTHQERRNTDINAVLAEVVRGPKSEISLAEIVLASRR